MDSWDKFQKLQEQIMLRDAAEDVESSILALLNLIDDELLSKAYVQVNFIRQKAIENITKFVEEEL